jgi:hypothetical protein
VQAGRRASRERARAARDQAGARAADGLAAGLAIISRWEEWRASRQAHEPRQGRAGWAGWRSTRWLTIQPAGPAGVFGVRPTRGSHNHAVQFQHTSFNQSKPKYNVEIQIKNVVI